jgi:hypothetical protein
MRNEAESRDCYGAWAAALDDLEQNVEELTTWLATNDIDSGTGELILATTTWSVPDLPGLIPTELVPRAQAIAIRQGDVRRELESRMCTIQQQRRLVRQVDATTARATRPAYIDVSA